jgi:hypothetical protein
MQSVEETIAAHNGDAREAVKALSIEQAFLAASRDRALHWEFIRLHAGEVRESRIEGRVWPRFQQRRGLDPRTGFDTRGYRAWRPSVRMVADN